MTPAAVLALGVLSLALVACAPGEPEIRFRYQAALDGFEVRQQPGTPDQLGRRLDQDVILHLSIQHDSPETLPRLPLDVTRVDVQGRVREHRRVWVDTSRIGRGQAAPVTQQLEDVVYRPGDGFRISISQTDDGPSA